MDLGVSHSNFGIKFRRKKKYIFSQIFDGPRSNLSKKRNKIFDRNIYLSFGSRMFRYVGC